MADQLKLLLVLYKGHSFVGKNSKSTVIDDERQVEIELCSSMSRLTLSDVQKPTPSSARSNIASSQRTCGEGGAAG